VFGLSAKETQRKAAYQPCSWQTNIALDTKKKKYIIIKSEQPLSLFTLSIVAVLFFHAYLRIMQQQTFLDIFRIPKGFWGAANELRFV